MIASEVEFLHGGIQLHFSAVAGFPQALECRGISIPTKVCALPACSEDGKCSGACAPTCCSWLSAFLPDEAMMAHVRYPRPNLISLHASIGTVGDAFVQIPLCDTPTTWAMRSPALLQFLHAIIGVEFLHEDIKANFLAAGGFPRVLVCLEEQA